VRSNEVANPTTTAAPSARSVRVQRAWPEQRGEGLRAQGRARGTRCFSTIARYDVIVHSMGSTL